MAESIYTIPGQDGAAELTKLQIKKLQKKGHLQSIFLREYSSYENGHWQILTKINIHFKYPQTETRFNS